MLTDLGFSVSVSKTAVLTCSSHPLCKGFPKLYLNGSSLSCANTHRGLDRPSLDLESLHRVSVVSLHPDNVHCSEDTRYSVGAIAVSFCLCTSFTNPVSHPLCCILFASYYLPMGIATARSSHGASSCARFFNRPK